MTDTDTLPQPSADVTTSAQVEAVAARILDRRERPLVLVSTSLDGEFLFDVGRLHTELADIADIVTIETGQSTRELEALLPPKTHAFAGAARSYPVDFGTDPAWHRSILRFPDRADTDDLIRDAMAQVGRRTLESLPSPSIRRAQGIVQGFVAGSARAIVRLDDGSTVTATADLLPPDIPLATALIVGEQVAGVLDGTELHPEPLEPDLDTFPDGCDTLALVIKVTDLRATVQLHPRASFILRRRDVDGGEGPVGAVLQVGDVVRVKVRYAPRTGIVLSRTDADPDAELIPALPLVADGAPWLREGRPVLTGDEGADSGHAASPGSASAAGSVSPAAGMSAGHPEGSAHAAAVAANVATRSDIAAVMRDVTALRGDMLALTNLVARSGNGSSMPGQDAELKRLRSENERLRAQLSAERAERGALEMRLAEATQSRKDNGRALKEARRTSEKSSVDTSAAGFRAEIARVWESRTAGGDRTLWPLRDYHLGPDFLASLDGLDDAQLSKAVRASVDAITGRDREISARSLHRLRSGDGGDDPSVTRSDGARCWRSSIEQNAPSARRLHYWELPNGGIELGRIVLHDDTRP